MKFKYARVLTHSGQYNYGVVMTDGMENCWYGLLGDEWEPNGGSLTDGPAMNKMSHWLLGGGSWDTLLDAAGINGSLRGEVKKMELMVVPEKNFLRSETTTETLISSIRLVMANSDGYDWGVPSRVIDLESSKYKKDTIYDGMQGYHHHHGSLMNAPVVENKKWKIGVELEVLGRSRSDYDYLKALSSNWVFKESDSSLTSYGIEFITIPLNSCDAKNENFWKPLVDVLSPRARSWDTNCCGLHVHIGREILGSTPEEQSETIGKLLYLYHCHIEGDIDAREVNKRVFGRACAYHSQDGRVPEGDAVKVLGADVLKHKSVRKKVGKALTDKSMQSRYYDINLQNPYTIEFRKGRGSINTTRIVSVIAWCEYMVLYCKRTEWTKITFKGFKDWLMAQAGVPSGLKAYIGSDV